MNTKIGIFDSGIGGVTVLKECLKVVSNFEYLYYSDSKHNPYGDKNRDIVIQYCDEIVKHLINMECKIIIIACNTASAMAVKYLMEKYVDIDFIAIEPAIKLAYDTNENGTLVMATKGTMDSQRFHELYDKYHHDKYYLVSCVGLANLIESDMKNKINIYLNKYISCYSGKVSNVVLGCTHYPLIKNEIKKVLGEVEFFDGSVGVAKQLYRVICYRGYVGCKNGSVSFEDSTGDVEKEKRFWKFLEGE